MSTLSLVNCPFVWTPVLHSLIEILLRIEVITIKNLTNSNIYVISKQDLWVSEFTVEVYTLYFISTKQSYTLMSSEFSSDYDIKSRTG